MKLYLPFIVAGVFVALFVVEKIFPLRESRAGLGARLVINLRFQRWRS
jgi:hypothetical protein